MRGGRGQRHHHDLIAALLLALLCGACSNNAPLSDADLYRSAASSLQHGELKQAESEIERGLSAWRDRPESIWHWNYRMLSAEMLGVQGRAKEALALVEPALLQSPELQALRARWSTVRAGVFLRLGRVQEARALLDEAESLASTSGERSLIPKIETTQGQLLLLSGRPDEAEQRLFLALKHAQEESDLYYQAAAQNNLGFSRLRKFRYDEAVPFLEGALTTSRQGGFSLMESAANTNLGLCFSRLGDFDKAIASLKAAVEIQERQGAGLLLQAGLGEIGNTYVRFNEPAKATEYYRRALDLAREAGALSDASKWAGNLATALIEVEDWDQAETFSAASVALKEEIGDTASQLYSKLNAADIAAGRKRHEEATSLYDSAIQSAAGNAEVLWEAHAGLATLFRETGDHPKAFSHFETAIRTIENIRSGYASNFRVTFLSRLMRFYQEYVDALVDGREFDKALQVAESSRARVLSERLGLRNANKTERLVQAPVRPGTVLLSYWLAPRRSFLWAITSQGNQLFVLPSQQDVETQLEAYDTFIQNLRDPLDAGSLAGSNLYNTLLQPAQALIPQGANVVIVPDGRLHGLNFETLLVPGSAFRYWIEDVTVSIAASVANSAEGAPLRSPRSILLIGDPETATAEFQRLPFASRELRQIEQRLMSAKRTVYEGSQASPAAYRESQPGTFSMIHFAAHATANRESPLESAIILSPASGSFKLYARDLLDTPLNADLVTISSCRSAGARVYSGEGLVGFAWTFLRAGANRVIAGLWDVSDASTAELMDNLYAGIASGARPAEALRQAKLALIRSSGNFRKPYYWAPFQIYIGGATSQGK